MKNAETEFTIDQYKALVAQIEEKIFENLLKAIEVAMPPSHKTKDTLYYVVLRLVTKALCSICEDDKQLKEGAIADFCETLPNMVREARIVIVPGNKNINCH